MEIWNWQRAARLTFLALPLAWRAEQAFHALPNLPFSSGKGALPSLSIITPARNEARNLCGLLTSLQATCYPGPLEIIVVDDGSTDATSEIARAHGAIVVPLQGPPPGWYGKPHACHRGVEAAHGEWLLFTDADLLHAPDGPRCAVAYAEAQHLDVLSLFVGQKFHDLMDRLALTVAFEGLFAGRAPGAYALNGQYILMRRSVYCASGGFAAGRSEPLEDLALGRHLRRLHYRVAVLHANDAAYVRMYDNSRQLWQGMTRLGAGSLRWSGVGSIFTIAFISAIMSPLIVATGVVNGRLALRWLPLTWLAATLSTLPWARRTGAPAAALLTPLGALLVQVAAVWGVLRRLLGRGITWKGRRV
ncbi:MAG TPA: glycosyltransferase, partial [Caldilinea sp.]|nr:glycosyltransferase [Caldilinea sp.]